MGLRKQSELTDARDQRARRTRRSTSSICPASSERFPAELSGGMRKRVGIARAIALRPKYILYDEPTTGLDPVTSAVIDQLMVRMREKLGVTGIVITHDMRSAYTVGTRIAMLYEGRVRVGRARSTRSSTRPIPSFVSSSRAPDCRGRDACTATRASRLTSAMTVPARERDVGRRRRVSPRRAATPLYLLIRDSYTNWGFPKGHLEAGERAEERRCARCARKPGSTTRARGAIDTIDWYFRFRGQLIHKVCHFFLMETARIVDVAAARRGHHGVPVDRRTSDARSLVSYANARDVLRRAHEMVARDRRRVDVDASAPRVTRLARRTGAARARRRPPIVVYANASAPARSCDPPFRDGARASSSRARRGFRGRVPDAPRRRRDRRRRRRAAKRRGASRRCAREYPSVPSSGSRALRAAEAPALAQCASYEFADVLVDGVDDGVRARHRAAALRFSTRFARALDDPPRALELDTPLQQAAWRFIVSHGRRPVRTQALADALGVTREHLSRSFAAAGAPNLKRIIDLVRLIAAAELAKNPGYDLRDVATILDFASVVASVEHGAARGRHEADVAGAAARVDLVERFTKGTGGAEGSGSGERRVPVTCDAFQVVELPLEIHEVSAEQLGATWRAIARRDRR